jgi:hypothetical protein
MTAESMSPRLRSRSLAAVRSEIGAIDAMCPPFSIGVEDIDEMTSR